MKSKNVCSKSVSINEMENVIGFLSKYRGNEIFILILVL